MKNANENIFIHALSDVQTEKIGSNTRIWQYVVILPGACIGNDVNICSHCLIENDVVIGDRVTIKSGVQLWDGIHIEDDVFVGANVTFTNDLFPRNKKASKPLPTVIHKGATLGANSTILPGVTIGMNATIGSGSIILRDVPPNAIVAGNPGVIIGYDSAPETNVRTLDIGNSNKNKRIDTGVGGCCVYELPYISDLRGSLSVVEFEKDLSFTVKRCFWLFDVPSKEVRGEHAHKECHQFLICVAGQASVMLDDSINRTEVKLDSPSLGLHIPPGVWGVQYKYSKDAAVIVLASHSYNAEDYIRDYNQFLAYKKQQL
jgi:acetyltransferase-like isoleucine patch superfamily enzyme/dTDP-4-dehydrorhamnose 3,5-epimerase-like enzyme